MGVLGTVLAVTAQVVSGIAAYNASKSQAEATRAAADQQSKVLENNAALARAEAEATGQQGFNEENRLRENARRLAASQRAAFGADNVSLASGSALDVGVDTAVQSDLDAGLLRQNYQRKRVGLENEAAQYGWQARESKRLGDFKASALESAGRQQLFGSLLSSAGTVASKWSSLSAGKSAAVKSEKSVTWGRKYAEGDDGRVW